MSQGPLPDSIAWVEIISLERARRMCVPRSGADSICMNPPESWTVFCTMLRPNPVPGADITAVDSGLE
jgi:hypothetical protein